MNPEEGSKNNLGEEGPAPVMPKMEVVHQGKSLQIFLKDHGIRISHLLKKMGMNPKSNTVMERVIAKRVIGMKRQTELKTAIEALLSTAAGRAVDLDYDNIFRYKDEKGNLIKDEVAPAYTKATFAMFEKQLTFLQDQLEFFKKAVSEKDEVIKNL
ncbi:MAG: hypothetical protein HRU12_09685, partial [Phaeodactylibacter sp.]|nr:hypothetical protein [Phaeodactylibacter sp.]